MKKIFIYNFIIMFTLFFGKTQAENVLSDNDTNSHFYITYPDGFMVSGYPGQTLEIVAELYNDSYSDDYIYVKKESSKLPPGWHTQFCAGYCYPPEIDSVVMYIQSKDKNYFGNYFVTDDKKEGTGTVTYSFTNKNNSSNSFTQTFIGSTSTFSTEDKNYSTHVNTYPNPFSHAFSLEMNIEAPQFISLYLYDMTGNIVMNSENIYCYSGKNIINILAGSLAPSNYICFIKSNKINRTLLLECRR